MKSFLKIVSTSFLLIASCGVPSHVFAVSSNTELTTLTRQTNDWIGFYYLHPEPNRTPEMINKIFRTNAIQEKKTRIPFIVFFAKIFQQNPEKISRWMRQIRYKNAVERRSIWQALRESNTRQAIRFLKRLSQTMSDQQSKKKIERILGRPPLKFLTAELDPIALHALWVSFAATGNSIYVNRIISVLNWTAEEKSGKEQLKTFNAAVSSLVSSAKNHKRVLIICKNALPHVSSQARLLLLKIIALGESDQTQ